LLFKALDILKTNQLHDSGILLQEILQGLGKNAEEANLYAFRLAEIKAADFYRFLALVYSADSPFKKLHWICRYVPKAEPKPFDMLRFNYEDRNVPSKGDALLRRMLILWDTYEPQIVTSNEDSEEHGLALSTYQIETHRKYMHVFTKVFALLPITFGAFTIKTIMLDPECKPGHLFYQLFVGAASVWVCAQVLLTIVEIDGAMSRAVSMTLGMETVTLYRGIFEMGLFFVELAFDFFSYQLIIRVSSGLIVECNSCWLFAFVMSIVGFVLNGFLMLLAVFCCFKYFFMFTGRLRKSHKSVLEGMKEFYVLDQGIWHAPTEQVIRELMDQHDSSTAEWEGLWPRLKDYTTTADKCMKSLLDQTGYVPDTEKTCRSSKSKNACLVRRGLGQCGQMQLAGPVHLSASTAFLVQQSGAHDFKDTVPGGEV
jgi:hypothetical protein